ncbi:Gamma-glutamyltranspeptidase 3 [Hibiscus syriacus]|uniref:Gamma-glutamyltranspeptidase 3 n=1 Tax=Hibiscus syriacus TaxID=106335 RepID=A0A6A3D839_HIBSY|nr:Gamma-glutamyltranspeptidase 3 [Hibiscus syriacus]
MLHSNANLGVYGQGFLNLSGPGDMIEAQRLILSLFYSIQVGPGSILRSPLENASDNDMQDTLALLSSVSQIEISHIFICRVEDINIEGIVTGSVVHFHWVRTVVIHSSGEITTSALGCTGGVGRGTVLKNGLAGGGGHGGKGGEAYYDGSFLEVGVSYGDADLPCELGSVMGSLELSLSSLSVYGSLRADGESFGEVIRKKDYNAVSNIGHGSPSGAGGGGGGRVHFHWSNIPAGDLYQPIATVNGSINTSPVCKGGFGRGQGRTGENGTITGKACPKGLYGIFCEECPLGTFKNVSGSDRLLCHKCPANELPSRGIYVNVRGGVTDRPCPYKCISERYHMPHCYTALEELVYTFGGPWFFALILLGLLILLALVLSVARMKYVGADELPPLMPAHRGSQIDHSFPFLEYEDAFKRFVDEVKGLTAYQWWEGSIYTILSIVAYPLAWRKQNNERVGVRGPDSVESEHGVVAADDGRCSAAGVLMLKKGGHAVDAAVATALCVGVVNPMSSGIGGGAFMVVRSSLTSQVQAFDSRETSPLAASQNMYANDMRAKYHGALSMGVPEAISPNVMNYTIYGMPLPSRGPLGLALVGNILDSYGSANAAMGDLRLHCLIEPSKHMFAERMNLGDPHFINITEYVSKMLSVFYARKIQEKIVDNKTFPASYYMYKWSQLKDHGTSHFSVVDADRNAMSMTTTVNFPFGAGVLSHSTGILINNGMGDFSAPTEISPDMLPPAPENFIRPNKKPLSSMAPLIIIKDNQLAGVIGGSDGMKIIPAVAQVFLNHFVSGMEPLAAVQHPRIYHKLIPNVISYENSTCINGDHIKLAEETKMFLGDKGHQLQPMPGGAVVQFVVQTLQEPIESYIFHGKLTAVSDPRKDGKPAAL